MNRSILLVAVLVVVMIGAWVALGDRDVAPVSSAPPPPQATVTGADPASPARATQPAAN